MWAMMAMLGRWVCGGTIQSIIHCDDGERACQLMGLFGCAFLTVLNAVDSAGKLTMNSELRDVSLVMSIYLEWSHGLEDYGIVDEHLTWRKDIVAYAKKASFDLKANGCHSMGQVLQDYSTVRPLKDVKKADRWSWRKNVSVSSATTNCTGLTIDRIVQGVCCKAWLSSKHKSQRGKNWRRLV